MNILERLELLRTQMQAQQIDIYLAPSIDAHNSEYVPECWQRRPWISGFDGSAGEVMVTLEHAYLWTDGRYFLQADQQLNPKEYTLMKQNGFTPETEQWLLEHGKNKKLGIDPRLVGVGRVNTLQKTMAAVNGQVVVIEDNLIDKCKVILGETLELPSSPAFTVGENFSGESLSSRLRWLRSELLAKQVEYIALNVLDEIAWLFNIRGADIEYNPLVISYALIGLNQAWLFVEPYKINHQLAEALALAGVKILDYTQFGDYLANLPGSIWLDDKTASYWMFQKVSVNGKISLARSPIVHKKALKNGVEADGSRYAHIKDAVAVINFIYWLEQNWQHGVDEIAAANKLAEYRQQQEHCQGLSFSTISGYASNGAIIHYRATPETSKVIRNDNLYLIDSGGQYLEGTTDITRTLHLGEPSAEHKKHYTLVLKGHLALARAIFSHGTCGEHLDALARAPLWNEYLNYRHGTGHGVGSFLCVHEGPQKISQAASGVPLLPGMIVSNEPGLYIDGSHGIRIENLCIVTEIKDPQALASEFGPFYGFEDLTLVPYSKELLAEDLLTLEEKQQIKAYYQQIQIKVAKRLGAEQQKWLLDQLNVF